MVMMAEVMVVVMVVMAEGTEVMVMAEVMVVVMVVVVRGRELDYYVSVGRGGG